jgi:hypothetical protein
MRTHRWTVWAPKLGRARDLRLRSGASACLGRCEDQRVARFYRLVATPMATSASSERAVAVSRLLCELPVRRHGVECRYVCRASRKVADGVGA